MDSNLAEIKPDMRLFGFNAPMPNESGAHGYEMWVTIPKDMEVPAPLIRKRFHGGLYAAYMINGEFERWGWLADWVFNNIVESDWGCRSEPETAGQDWALEEHLNYYGTVTGNHPGQMQFDLLFPIKKK